MNNKRLDKYPKSISINSLTEDELDEVLDSSIKQIENGETYTLEEAEKILKNKLGY